MFLLELWTNISKEYESDVFVCRSVLVFYDIGFVCEFGCGEVTINV